MKHTLNYLIQSQKANMLIRRQWDSYLIECPVCGVGTLSDHGGMVPVHDSLQCTHCGTYVEN